MSAGSKAAWCVNFFGGFAISMKLPPLKREKLADQLTWLANRHELGMPEDRRHERIRARTPRTTLHPAVGARSDGGDRRRVALGRRAFALELGLPPVGTPVTVGVTKGRVVRVFANGLAIEFARVIPEIGIRRNHRTLSPQATGLARHMLE